MAGQNNTNNRIIRSGWFHRHWRGLAVMALCVIAVIPVLFGVYIDFYRIDGLEVSQDGLVLSANWDSNKTGEYNIKVTRGGQVISDVDTNDTVFAMDLDKVDEEYQIAVAPKINGGFLGRSEESIETEKADQNIYLNKYLLEGFEKSRFALEGKSRTPLTFESSNKNVATVSKEGKIRYKREGSTRITVTAPESDLYNAATEVAVVNVYPTKLESPKLKVDKSAKTKGSKTRTSVGWNAVPYASEYVVSKFDPWTGTMKEVKKVKKDDPLSVEIKRNDETYVVQAEGELLGVNVTSDESEPLDIKSASHDAETYSSLHILDVLDSSKLERLMEVKGLPGTTCPQSFSYTGKGYLLAFTNKAGNKNALVEYSEDGEQIRAKYVKMGHANGSAYNPVTGLVYTLKRHLQIKSKACKAFSFDSFEEVGSFDLPKMASGISYDTSCNKFYLSGGGSVFVTDSEFNLERTIDKVVRRDHTQDTGAANGVALSCSWNSGSDSYVDLYRCSDGGYLGTYKVPMGEIESATFVDKHLVVLINNTSDGSGDVIYRSKEEIPVI